MKICLDGRGNYFGGVYTYTYSLLRALPDADPDLEYLALFDQHQVDEGRLPVDTIPYRTVPVMSPLKMIWWNNFKLPKLLEEENIDLYHGFKHFGLRYPTNHSCKMIWTLRTASWWLFPELFSLHERLFWTRYYALGAKRLDQSVCVAHADKKAFVDAIGIDPDTVTVTQLAADQRFLKVEDDEVLRNVRQKYKLPDDYILFVGTIYPFKNIETIISVFANIVESGLSHELVLVGGVSPAYGDSYKKGLMELAQKLGVKDRIHWVGSIFDDLPAVYTMADLLLFPSLFEAFAKPPLEAMACDTPVVASNAAGLPEVIGDAGLMAEPTDVRGLSKLAIEALTNQDLRAELIGKGHSQLIRFSWERCADETAKLYRRVLNM
ncbi:putative Similar to mannosyltransferase B [uncultured Woeseiaceae bacterium]|uniref:Putative Similar to mannosyltransferase B n=1 Tax=uncultured Woeseiaceae bacterium TaxID=1983305 RepID=A0A7D9D1Q3_9GAMM|nr:putative Similar to mannosyltransferase B [uncultured Woeseiaceae bacterium]